MIESDRAELVDDDRRLREIPLPARPCKWGRVIRFALPRKRGQVGRGPLEQAIEQCGLAGAEKAGQHRKRNGRWHRRAMARRHCGSVLGVICSGVFAAGLALAPAVAAAALSLPGEGLPGEGLGTLAAAAGLGCAAAAAGVGFAAGSAAGAGLAVGGLAATASGFFFGVGAANAGAA